jgi:ribonuclease VapC
MFIDASAIVAILLREEGSDEIVRRIGDIKGQIYTSPIARYEATVSLARARSGKRRPTADQVLVAKEAVNTLLTEIGTKDIHITSSIGDKAIEAAMTYGKTVGHAADLNFGDCFAYACAKAYRTRLIYKGNDFAKTDLA